MSRSISFRRATLFVALLFAGSISHAAGWTPSLTVHNTFTEDSDYIVVYTTDGGAYTPNCAANSWMFQASNDARRGRAYATVLAAVATGKKIQFWYTDSCGPWGYHQATSIRLIN